MSGESESESENEFIFSSDDSWGDSTFDIDKAIKDRKKTS